MLGAPTNVAVLVAPLLNTERKREALDDGSSHQLRQAASVSNNTSHLDTLGHHSILYVSCNAVWCRKVSFILLSTFDPDRRAESGAECAHPLDPRRAPGVAGECVSGKDANGRRVGPVRIGAARAAGRDNGICFHRAKRKKKFTLGALAATPFDPVFCVFRVHSIEPPPPFPPPSALSGGLFSFWCDSECNRRLTPSSRKRCTVYRSVRTGFREQTLPASVGRAFFSRRSNANPVAGGT